MRVAVVGKGGSGKSSVSWLLTRSLSDSGSSVLAIDADYNLDLAHNLGWDESMPAPFFNHSEKDFNEYQRLASGELHIDLPLREKPILFSSNPADKHTEKYSIASPQDPRIKLIISGAYHEDSLYGNKCSHNYMKMIKYYLPLLKVPQGDFVVVDSVAGTDMVVYGLYLGVDLLVVVVEPTRHSLGVYRQIKSVADEFNIPVCAVVNKFQPGPMSDLVDKEIGSNIIGRIPLDAAIPVSDYTNIKPETRSSLADIRQKISLFAEKPEKSLIRIKNWRLKRKNDD